MGGLSKVAGVTITPAFAYGPHPSQVADLYVPEGPGPSARS